MERMRTATATLCLFLLVPGPARTQNVTRGAWERVAALPPDSAVRVWRFEGRELRGRLVSVDLTVLTLRADSSRIAVPRDQVQEVRVRRGSARAKNAGIGAAVGAGGGAGFGGILRAIYGDSDLWLPIFLVATLAGAVIGFGVGWLVPGYSTVYRATR